MPVAEPHELARLIEEVLRPRNFYLQPGLELERKYRPQTESIWEVHRGRLLGPNQTRERKTFDVWEIWVASSTERPAEPLLSVRLDRAARQLHVTRSLECYVWEPYDEGDNVIRSREVRRWVAELVGTIDLDHFPDPADLRAELRVLLFQAVIGCSRLPLTSVEAPLPAFTLGQIAYFHRDQGEEPMRACADLLQTALHHGQTWQEKVKTVELFLRSSRGREPRHLTALLAARWPRLGHTPDELPRLFRAMFNDVALSPYTDFVDQFLALLQACVANGLLTVEHEIDCLSYLLRQVVRHLTAYDLVTFHHRGANYPDALFLDAALKRYLAVIESAPALYLRDSARPGDERRRLRRRALRQAWMLRRRYEGLPVPAHPTSPGENARVLPPPFVRLLEQDILDPAQRSRRLYDGDALAAHLGKFGKHARDESIADLEHVAELRELGMALFLDRPFGLFKAPGEPDQTPLLSYEAFSPCVAEQRLRYLADELRLLPGAGQFEALRERLRASVPAGVALPHEPRAPRQSCIVSLRDAECVAADFVFLRTTEQSARELLSEYDFAPLRARFGLDFLDSPGRLLVLADEQGEPTILRVYDSRYRRRLECLLEPGSGYRRRRGRESLADGLRVLYVWEDGPAPGELRERDLRQESYRLLPHEKSG